jgi:hypothetical protein
MGGMLPHLAKSGAFPALTGLPPGTNAQPLKMRVGEFPNQLDFAVNFRLE